MVSGTHHKSVGGTDICALAFLFVSCAARPKNSAMSLLKSRSARSLQDASHEELDWNCYL